ncbi:hypothetical protein F441_17865 [Phytophthora nicotianae CJ01A1]|uniref:Uncharacterized protein n=2 Tax=Phytophthora nicotianae TaxID=4792 RepID=W2W7N8_PHYNI|nr:hypothetical protein L916_17407 [Phytophthora nicotianae]ETP05584.1 hypothetical protein F441_17865 [Phytophthora nicotianae CJ01A1]
MARNVAPLAAKSSSVRTEESLWSTICKTIGLTIGAVRLLEVKVPAKHELVIVQRIEESVVLPVAGFAPAMDMETYACCLVMLRVASFGRRYALFLAMTRFRGLRVDARPASEGGLLRMDCRLRSIS